LVYVFRDSDDLFVNDALLREGFADLAIYSPNVAYQDVLASAHTTARTRDAGLWAACGGADVPLDPPPITVPID